MWRTYRAAGDSDSDTDSSEDYRPTSPSREVSFRRIDRPSASSTPARSLRRHGKVLWQLDNTGRMAHQGGQDPLGVGGVEDPDWDPYLGGGVPAGDGGDGQGAGIAGAGAGIAGAGAGIAGAGDGAGAAVPVDIQGLFQGITQMITTLNDQNQRVIAQVLGTQRHGRHTRNPDNPQVFQSYSDDLVKPKPFTGKDTEDVITFLKKVKWYSKEKAHRLGIDWKDHVMRYIRNYLEGEALSFYENSDVPFNTWTEVEDRFTKRYAGVTGKTFLEITTLKMERGESIDQYAAKFDRACNRLRMHGIARLHQFIANVLPEFRSSLVANPVATYEDALARCRTISDNTECIKADAQVLKALTERLEKIENKQQSDNKKDNKAKVNAMEQPTGGKQQLNKGQKHQNSGNKQFRQQDGNAFYQNRQDNSQTSVSQERQMGQNHLRRGRRQATRQDECYNCHKKGHFAHDCWSRPRGDTGSQPTQRWNNRGPPRTPHINHLQQQGYPQQPGYFQQQGYSQSSQANGLSEHQVGYLTKFLSSLQEN